jgi:transmembrane protein TMEM260 (protein O-mannosyltransferase)
MVDEAKLCASAVRPVRFFQRPDWGAFCLAALLSFAVYLRTLIPANDLGFSGIYSTSALYLGVSNPPAYPVWTLYSTLFVRLIPFSNIAWRVAVATSVASSLTCGLIALMVSRIGFLAVENVGCFQDLSLKEQKSFRIVCGCVAGLGFGLDGCFWSRAVIADQWNFNVFLFSLTVCLLTRWFFAPQQRRYLCLGALMLGLVLGDSEALFPAAFALPFLLALGDPKVGREIFFFISVFFCGVLVINPYSHWLDRWLDYSTFPCEITATVLVVLVWIILLILTRKFFSEWKTTLSCALLFFAGTSAWFLLPLFSMADPPMNWGYPRTVEGFFHVISRGQYGADYFVVTFHGLLVQWAIYGKIAIEQFGLVYLAAASVPVFLLHKVPSLARRWIIGLLAVWFFLSLTMSVALNISLDKSSYELNQSFFSPAHFLLAVLAGCGMMLIAAFWARPAQKIVTPNTDA